MLFPRPGRQPAYGHSTARVTGGSSLLSFPVMLKPIAETLNINIPDEQLDEIEPVLDELMRDIRRALDRDLATIDPVTRFQPGSE